MGKQQQRDKIARLISWGHWFTFVNILISLAVGTLYVEAAEPPGTILGVVYMLVSWIGHFAFLPFVFFIILIFPFCMLVPYARVLRGIAALLASLGLIALVADAVFFRYYGYHLNTYSLSQLASDAEAAFAGASFVIILALLLSFLVILAFEVVIANLAWKRLDDIQRRRIGAPVTTVFVLCFLVSHSVHIWADGVFYRPITQQDDLFPVSYPTTAKTLMADHGLIDPQIYEARQEIMNATDDLKLNYPTTPLMCAKVPNATSATLVVFEQLDNAQQAQLLQRLPELKLAPVTLLGHPDAARGAFQLTYAIADIYQRPIQNEQREPAYLPVLTDFSMAPRWLSTPSFTASHLTPVLQEKLNDLAATQVTATASLDMVFTNVADTEAVVAYLQQRLAENGQVYITALSATSQSMISAEGLAPNELQVPLLHNNQLAVPPQQLANLTDIVPTVLSSMVNCTDGLTAVSHGKNLHQEQSSYPQVVSFSPYIVIYDEDLTTVLDRNGQMQVFGSTNFNLIENAEPPTPVLVDAIKELKRFSQDGAEKERK